jgi:hypothetical protein
LLKKRKEKKKAFQAYKSQTQVLLFGLMISDYGDFQLFMDHGWGRKHRLLVVLP